jgi:hypothetical protein
VRVPTPVNPQTRTPAGQAGYARAFDVGSGNDALASVVNEYANYAASEAKKRELFDVSRKIVDETNNIQTDFDAKTTAQPLGAPNFTQQVAGEYQTRHDQMVKELKDQGYSNDAVQEYATRLGAIRSQYVAKAIDFQDKSNFAKVVDDSDKLAVGLSQIANKNPNAVGSTLDEMRVALTQSGLDAVEQETVYQAKKAIILKGAQDGFATQNPELVMRMFDPEHVTTSTVNVPDGSTLPIATQNIKPNGALADNIVAGLKNRGLSDFLARGIAAGITAESSNNVTAFNNTGGGEGAFGLGQWRGDRLKALRAKYGAKPTGSQQLDFLVSELNGGDPGGKTVLSQADEVAALHSYIHDFMRPSAAGEKVDLKNGLAALGRKVAAHATATEAALIQPDPNKTYNQEDAIRELGMTADQAAEFVATGKDTRTAAAPAGVTTAPEAMALVGADGKTGIPVVDLSSGPEREQMLTLARAVYNEHRADAITQNREAHAAYYNNFLNGLQDGTLGQADLNTAYTSGQITDFDERKKAQTVIDDKNKKNDDLLRFGAMLHSGGKFNPYDDKAQSAADAGFEAAVKDSVKNNNNASPFLIALNIYQRTGIIPKQGAVILRGGLISTNPQDVAGAAAVANNMIRQNPNAFAGTEGQAEIEHAAVAYGHYIYDLGMSPQEASTKVAQENDPKFKEKFKYNDPATQELLKTLRQNGVDATKSFNGAKFPNQDTLNEGNQTYYELLRDQLNRGLDLGQAMAQVDAQMQKVYGVNALGHVVKYPPEKAYPQVNGTWDYIYHDAQKTVKDETGREPIHINLAPIPGVTDEDFRNGRRARYRIIYSYNSHGQTIVDSVPGEFAADVAAANQEASIKNQNEFNKARQAEVKRGPPVVFPGIGEVR